MAFKKGDFITIEYTAKVDGVIFDTTSPDTAKKHHLEHVRQTFKPITICIGEGQVIKGVDMALEGKENGSFSVHINPVEGFGKKSAAMLKMIPMKQFTKQQMKVFPGLEVQIDGHYGVVKTVSAGRVIVDFNHPLAGKELDYDITIIEQVTDKKKQVEAMFDIIGIPYEKITVENDHAIITLSNIPPKSMADYLSDIVKKVVSLKALSFEAGKKDLKKEGEKKA